MDYHKKEFIRLTCGVIPIIIKGKYKQDGIYGPNLVSKQVGAAVLLRRMSECEIAVKDETDIITQIKQAGEEVAFDPKHYHENAANLQRLLNMIRQHL